MISQLYCHFFQYFSLNLGQKKFTVTLAFNQIIKEDKIWSFSCHTSVNIVTFDVFLLAEYEFIGERTILKIFKMLYHRQLIFFVKYINVTRTRTRARAHACSHACTHARTHARTHTRTHARTRRYKLLMHFVGFNMIFCFWDIAI